MSAHPQYCLEFLLRSKTRLKEHPPIITIANSDSKPEHRVRLICTHYQVQITLLHSGIH